MATLISGCKITKVRKNHLCQGCGKVIEKGEKVQVSTYADDGSIYSFYECDACAKFYERRCKLCKDFHDCMGKDYYVGLIKECNNLSC